jgi:hypothetical protein
MAASPSCGFAALAMDNHGCRPNHARAVEARTSTILHPAARPPGEDDVAAMTLRR